MKTRVSLRCESLDPRDLPAALASPPFPLADTFALHSRPEAAKVIFLDFDGHVRKAGTPDQTIIGPYNPVGDASFDPQEREVIQKAWLRVSEDFSPFDVDVTTQDSGDDALRYSGGTDTRWGVRVQVGNADPTDGETGAWGYVDTFRSSNADPGAFVYMGTSTNDRQMASFITHEVGHVLGLSHDGRTTPQESYFGGYLTPTGTRWTTNMGISYGWEVLDQWSKGEYANANNTQDDLAIITGPKNFGYRADDVGNTNATAKPLTAAAGALVGAGVIERNTDVDVYSFTLTRQTDVTIAVDPAAFSPNLDILAKLYSGSTLEATSDPADALSGSIRYTLPAGQYFVSVDGTGQGDPRTNGYSDYGSLGQYTVRATLQTVGSVNIAGGLYELTNANSGMALSAPATAAAGTQVTQAAVTGGRNQQWNVQAVGGGYYTLNHVATGLRLDNAGSSTTGGTRVVLWSAHGGDNQLWFFRPGVGGRLEVVNKLSGLVLDVSGGSKAAGAPIIQWAAHQGANQQWGFGPHAARTYTNSDRVAIPDLATATSSIAVAEDLSLTDVNVRLNIAHTSVKDLVISLRGPDGTEVSLVARRGGNADDFTETTFDDQAGTTITTATAPFTGTFRPEGSLAGLNGKIARGTWTLVVKDVLGADVGAITSWSLVVSGSPRR